jgi:hypothetical protein
MPVHVVAWKCSVCGHEFTGRNAKRDAIKCEESGTPDFIFAVGDKVTYWGKYLYTVTERYYVRPSRGGHRKHYAISDGTAWSRSVAERHLRLYVEPEAV